MHMFLGNVKGERNLASIVRFGYKKYSAEEILQICKVLNKDYALPTSPILCLWETIPRPLFIEQMLKNGSDVNWADHNGNTLLMYASGYQPQKYGFQSSSSNYSELDYCKLFLQYGADVSKQNKDGWTALDYAVQLGGGEETVEVLLSYGTTVTP